MNLRKWNLGLLGAVLLGCSSLAHADAFRIQLGFPPVWQPGYYQPEERACRPAMREGWGWRDSWRWRERHEMRERRELAERQRQMAWREYREDARREWRERD